MELYLRELQGSYIVEKGLNLCLFTRQMNGNWDSIPLDIADAIKYKIKTYPKD